MKNKYRKSLLSILLILSLLLPLTGCNGGDSAKSRTATSEAEEDSGTAASEAEEDFGTATSQVAVAATALSDRTNPLEFEIDEMTEDESKQIDMDVFSKERTVLADPSDSISVQARDWSEYSVDHTVDNLSSSDQEFWLRLKTTAEDYMNNCSVDASLNDKGRYVTYCVEYADLGIDIKHANDLVCWFLYSNPQYWFLGNFWAPTSTGIHLGIYEQAANGFDRAAITNSLFETIDEMASAIEEQGSDYEKVSYANKLICGELDYNLEAPYNQSIYSSFVQKETVCAGYAGAMTVLLNKAGVDAVSVTSDNHAWNNVKMDDGLWYGEDATWNDGSDLEEYLLVSDDNLNKDDGGAHNVSDYAVDWVPELSSEDYNVGGETASEFGAPTNLTFEYISDSEVHIGWDSVPNADMYEYKVLEGSNELLSKTIKTTFLGLTGLNASMNITFQVRAVNGDDYSEWTSGAYTSSASEGGEVDAPDNFKVVDVGSDTIEVQWDEVEEAKYELSLYRDEKFEVLLDSEIMSVRGATLSKLDPEQTYYLRLRAIKNLNGSDAYSEWVDLECTTSGADQSGYDEFSMNFSAPKNPAGSFIDDSTLRLTWQAVSGASEYEVIVYDDDKYSDLVGEFKSKQTAIQITDVSKDKEYYIRIRSVSLGNNSVMYSGWIDVPFSLGQKLSSASQLEAPANPDWWINSDGEVTIGFETLEEADHYEMGLFYEDEDQPFFTQDYNNAEHKNPNQTVVLACTLVGFPRDRTVYVKIRSIAQEGSGMDDSNWSTLTVNAPSEYTTLLEPDDLNWEFNDDGEVTISFQAVDGADYYDVNLCYDAEGTDCFFQCQYDNPGIGNAVAGTIVGFPRDRTVYVRVKSHAPNGSDTVSSDWVTMEVNALN